MPKPSENPSSRSSENSPKKCHGDQSSPSNVLKCISNHLKLEIDEIEIRLHKRSK